MVLKILNMQKHLDSSRSPVSQEVCRRLARPDSAAHIVTSIKGLSYNLPA